MLIRQLTVASLFSLTLLSLPGLTLTANAAEVSNFDRLIVCSCAARLIGFSRAANDSAPGVTCGVCLCRDYVVSDCPRPRRRARAILRLGRRSDRRRAGMA